MRFVNGRLTVSPTDLANFLACRHKTALDLRVAKGELDRPSWKDPLAEVLRERGDQHERQYVARLRSEGLSVVDLGGLGGGAQLSATLDAMRDGPDVIVQPALCGGIWTGYGDVLRKVRTPSPALGDWSYEVHDTKLSRETRGGTILQLSVYSELLGAVQGVLPEHFRVVTPLQTQDYRANDFAAFYRQTKSRFLEFIDAAETPFTYPEPTDHCPVCRWSSRCGKQRRDDDHLSLVCGLTRQHNAELSQQGIQTVAAFASLPVPLAFEPTRGSKGTYARLREQARLQVEQRTCGKPRFELLTPDPQFGLPILPEPRPGDLFLDLEGDPFARRTITGAPGEGSREYLFGLGQVLEDGSFSYSARWAFTDADERAAFDAVMSDIAAALDADPSIHVYHYAPYEPAAFKRLMGRYAAREQDLDRLLRGRRFVDLYGIVRHALRAGVETYSIKSLEPFYGFIRDIDLDEAGNRRRIVEVALEMNDSASITSDIRAAVETYNRDDCRSLVDLRNWLESLRPAGLARPPLEPDQASEEITDRQRRISALRARLLADVPAEAADHTPEQRARYLLAYLLDWHYREDKAVWWEYYRLLELSDDELLDEPNAVAGLHHRERVEIIRNKKTGKPTGSVVDRYGYPPQEFELRKGARLNLRDQKTFGEIQRVDRVARTLDVRKGPSVAGIHPTSAFGHERVAPDEPAAALFRLGELVADRGMDALPGAAHALLSGETARALPAARSGESPVDYAARIAPDIGETALPIQGPPGAGKTYTGAKMICALVSAGKRVGVTATGHKVIRNLLDAVALEASESAIAVRLGHKPHKLSEDPAGVIEFDKADEALAALTSGGIDVLGGTAWLWAREDAMRSVDVLCIDEAGQMSLANALAVCRAAPALVLLGDPQQLEQPQKASHPDGVGISVLDHVLEGHQTMPPERGLFLPVTWRLAPSICAFTSEVFYEHKLTSKPGLDRQRLAGPGAFAGSGLFYVEANHDARRSACDEEAAIVEQIVGDLLTPGRRWIDQYDREQPITLDDILIVAPYNAHVARLQERLAPAITQRGMDPAALRVGTVDKFQGQEAAIVIFSMATSRPDDAPRGMEFLYSPNRLNVATSRARCASILVASPRLFEPDCRTPRHMQLANALCRFREMAKTTALAEQSALTPAV